MFAAYASRSAQSQITFDTTRTPKVSLLVGFTESRGLTANECSKLALRRAEEQMDRLRSQISRRPVGFRIMNLVFQAIDARLEYLRGLDTTNPTTSPVDDAAGTGSEELDGSPSPHLATEGDSLHVSDAGVSSTGPPDAQVDSTTDVRQGAAP
ncbi:hypothetical protein NDN08_004892 [Rhodosorus marinus]|uniref:Uncharacterized protein n=1 Tax=Rhodosorus marinus TaxID=101924 RepID=A0AAV8UEX8_9RHOD|nr:hypothetical protein NDN08_004892 [Rhodosorus marinus]